MSERLSRNEFTREPGSMVMQLNDVGYATYDRVLFQDLSLNIKHGEVTAVSGRSGSGKTVLMRILAGLEQPELGRVDILQPNARIMYVPQELEDISIDTSAQVRDILRSARGLDQLEERMIHLEQIMGDDQEAYEQYLQLLELYEQAGGYSQDTDMQRVLGGLGVDEKASGHITGETTLGEVSSGQLRKILLAGALYGMPNLMVLDDPTSHLDVQTTRWLAQYLNNAPSAVVYASNNASFIDATADQTVGLTDVGRVFNFTGGYSEMVRKRDELIAAEQLEARTVEEKINQLRKTLANFRSKQVFKRSADMAQVGRALESRVNRLQTQYNAMPGSQDVFRNEQVRDLVFKQKERSGKDVFVIQNPKKAYGDFTALQMKSREPIVIHQGEKWLVWGPNGAGKSTLVRMMAHVVGNGDFVPDSGRIEAGANVSLGYFTPDITGVAGDATLLEHIATAMESPNMGRLVSVLRYFGFSSEAIYNQKIGTLSSGEKKRLALARLMIDQPNVLILDEPTGDYTSEEMANRLAQSLVGYDGTLILVSHDTDFIQKLPIDRVLHLPQGKVEMKK